MPFEYLIFNLFIFLSSSVGVLVYPSGRVPKVRAAMLAILSVSLPYLLWDHLVTGWWWEFHSRYTMQLNIGRLPLEEILFFFSVPWACLIIWENLKSRISGKVRLPVESFVLIASLMLGFVSVMQLRWYSASIAALGLLLAGLSWKNSQWLRQKNSLVLLVMVAILTSIFNGYLTARPVVRYNPAVKMPWQVFSIPIEDYGYGFVLIAATVMMYERRLRSSSNDVKKNKLTDSVS